jgi:hypothetical protein
MKIRGTFCEKTLTPKRLIDQRSLRWKRSGKSWLLIGCPRGRWRANQERCGVGTRGYKILTPADGRCSRGAKRIKKT